MNSYSLSWVPVVKSFGELAAEQFAVPSFLFAIGVLLALTFACIVSPKLRPLFSMVWRMWLGAALGVLIAAIAVATLISVPRSHGAVDLRELSRAVGVPRALLLSVIPLLASVNGFVAGAAAGGFWGWKVLRGRSPRKLADPVN